jgi:hypothetical protein
MRPLLQDLRYATGSLRKSAASSVTTALIIVLVLAIDIVTFARLGKAVICHFYCGDISRSVGSGLEETRTNICKVYSNMVNSGSGTAAPGRWLDICRSRV